MSCKSAIYLVNSTTAAVPVDGVINPGTTVRRFGSNVALSGNGVLIGGSGYYHVIGSVTLVAVDAGVIGVQLLSDGSPVIGALAQETVVAGGTVNLNINALVRLVNCNANSTLTLQLTGVSATVANSALTVEKI